ncbi:MAG: hypothetical protein JXA06_12275 [Bacteroidetes bacterium]|nr:hypothetical protein [Bacteroidota bacterium]
MPFSIEDLKANFTDNAKAEFEHSVKDYADKLSKEARKRAERLGVAGDLPLEISFNHLEEAKWILQLRGLSRRRRWWLSITQAFEYIFSATAGIGASNFSYQWGQLLFIGSLGLGLVLFVIRLNKESEI